MLLFNQGAFIAKRRKTWYAQYLNREPHQIRPAESGMVGWALLRFRTADG